MLSDYRRELESLGATRTLCIGTSAVRDAENGEAFLGEIEWSYGFTTRLLTGDEEAELTLRGVGAVEPGTLVVDVGGGSTELQVVDGRLRASLDVGCVRMTERFGEDVTAIRAHVRSLLPTAQPVAAVGVAGTVTTIAALDLGLAAYDAERIHGHVVSAAAVEAQTARLAGLTLEQREQIVEPGRAPVIVAGGAILTEVLCSYGLDGIRASERDILHGAALAAAELPEPEEGAAPPGALHLLLTEMDTARVHRAEGGGAPPQARPGSRAAAARLELDRLDLLEGRLVLREPTLQHRAREHADEPAVLEHGDALEVVLLEEAERLVQRELGVDRVQRHLDDLAQRGRARVAARRDDLADERLSRDDAEQPAVVFADEDRAHLRAAERLAGLLRAGAAHEHGRIGDHGVADAVHEPHYGSRPRSSNRCLSTGGGSRTRTAARPADFKSAASTSSATPARPPLVAGG